MYSPLWKITHQTPSVSCTPPFEKIAHQTPSVSCTPPFEKITHQNQLVLCTPPFEKSPIKSHLVLCTPPFEKSLFLVGVYFGVGVNFGKYGTFNVFILKKNLIFWKNFQVFLKTMVTFTVFAMMVKVIHVNNTKAKEKFLLAWFFIKKFHLLWLAKTAASCHRYTVYITKRHKYKCVHDRRSWQRARSPF